MDQNHWLLPEGIEELLPPQSEQAEQLRRRLLDLFQSWGYRLIIPPFIEYLESLLTGAGQDLDLQTFKITDQISGRLLGLRADMTPQAARIDAHRLKTDHPTRLCYIGSVFRTKNGLGNYRNPIQIGAELFGHSGLASDIEMIHLMLKTLQTAGIERVHLELGHAGIFRQLAKRFGLNQAKKQALFEALQKKSAPEVDELVHDLADGGDYFRVLIDLNGDERVLEQAESVLDLEEIQIALQELKQVGQWIKQYQPDLPIHYDLAELRAYQYQTGLAFAAFIPEWGQEIARGGRYDGIGIKFGRYRPATGFSADLSSLMRFSQIEWAKKRVIYAPPAEDPQLSAKINALRQQGCIVIQGLSSTDSARDLGCTEELFKAQDWQIRSLLS